MYKVKGLFGALAERLAPKIDAYATCGSYYTSSGCDCICPAGMSGTWRYLKLCWACSDGTSGCGPCSSSNGMVPC